MKKFIVGIFLFLSFTVFAQYNSALLYFGSYPGSSGITITWALAPNANCGGDIILQSCSDSNFYNPIQLYTTPIVNSSSMLSYQFIDANSTSASIVYYRLIVGSCGQSQVINGNSNNSLNYKLFPNPFNEQATLIFQNPKNLSVNLYVFDHNGQLLKKTETFQGNTYLINRDNFYAGLYYFAVATNTDLLAWGKFYVKDN